MSANAALRFDAVVGPDDLACEQLRAEILDVAIEALARAAEAFAAGRDDHGALYLQFSERLVLLVGRVP